MGEHFSNRLVRSAGLSLLLVVAACGPENILGTDHAGSSQVPEQRMITVGEPVVKFTPGTGALSVELPATIRNTLSESIFYFPCNWVLGRRVGSSWIAVWKNNCLLGSYEGDLRIEVRPDSQHTRVFKMVGTLGRTDMEDWHEPVTGEYRLTVNLFTKTAALSDEQRRSAPFELRVE